MWKILRDWSWVDTFVVVVVLTVIGIVAIDDARSDDLSRAGAKPLPKYITNVDEVTLDYHTNTSVTYDEWGKPKYNVYSWHSLSFWDTIKVPMPFGGFVPILVLKGEYSLPAHMMLPCRCTDGWMCRIPEWTGGKPVVLDVICKKFSFVQTYQSAHWASDHKWKMGAIKIPFFPEPKAP